MTTPTLTGQLADWAVGLDARRLPPEVLAAAVECVTDTLGCAIAGHVAPAAVAVRRTVEARVVDGASTTLGLARRLPAAEAAFVNGTAAHALELDDTDSVGFCHVGAVVVPAVLAVAEEQGTSGLELLAAVVTGYEVSVRLARWFNPRHRLQGFHTTATVPTLGAAAAVARLREMGARETESALGVAGSFASGTFEFLHEGTNLKRVHAGKAAYSAVLAVDLAGNGVEGPSTVLEGRAGLQIAMAGPTHLDLDLTDLGMRWTIREVGRKPHPCCRFCHASIDAAIELHRRGVVINEDDRVSVTVSRLCADQTGDRTPGNELGRQFSTPYGIALGLIRGRTTLADFRDRPDPAALELARRITVHADPDIPVGDRAARLDVASRHGVRARAHVAQPLGEPDNPLSPVELREKFLDLAGTVLAGKGAQDVHDLLLGLADLPDLVGLGGALMGTPAR